VDGDLAGFGLLNLQGSKIELLYVAPHARFRGVSKSLLASLEKEAIGVGIRELTLESTATALPFYSGRGYTPSGPSARGFGVTACYPMSRLIVTAR
jgi:GNAT superfamily N-acetyltransferase